MSDFSRLLYPKIYRAFDEYGFLTQAPCSNASPKFTTNNDDFVEIIANLIKEQCYEGCPSVINIIDDLCKKLEINRAHNEE